MAKNVQLTVDIKGGDSVGKAAEKTKSLKTQLKELKAELASGTLDGKAFDQVAKQAGKLQEQIDDVNQSVKSLANNNAEIALNGFMSLAQGITGGFAAAQGAMALFGSENEDLQKQMVKLQGAIALLNGIEAVNNTLKKEGGLLTAANTIKTNVLTFAQARYTAAVGSSVGIMKIFRIVGLAIPIIALVTGITLLIANFDKIKKVVEKFLPSLKAMGDFFGMIIDKVTDFIGITSDASREVDRLKKSTEELNSQNESALKQLDGVIGKEKQRYQLQKDILLNNLELAKSQYELDKSNKDYIKGLNEANDALIVLENSEKNRLNELGKKQQEQNEKAESERKSAVKKRQDDVAKEALDRLKAFEDELKFKQEVEDTYNEAQQEKELERQKAYGEQVAEELKKQADDQIAFNNLITESEVNLQDAKIGLAMQTSQFLQSIAGKQKGIALAALAVEKGAAIADVIIKGIREKADISAKFGTTPAYPFLLGASIARTALSVATISATGISGARSISSGGSGGSVQPPSIRGTQTQRDSNTNQRQPDTKVFVTETDIRAVSRKVDGIYSQATIR